MRLALAGLLGWIAWMNCLDGLLGWGRGLARVVFSELVF